MKFGTNRTKHLKEGFDKVVKYWEDRVRNEIDKLRRKIAKERRKKPFNEDVLDDLLIKLERKLKIRLTRNRITLMNNPDSNKILTVRNQKRIRTWIGKQTLLELDFAMACIEDVLDYHSPEEDIPQLLYIIKNATSFEMRELAIKELKDIKRKR